MDRHTHSAYKGAGHQDDDTFPEPAMHIPSSMRGKLEGHLVENAGSMPCTKKYLNKSEAVVVVTQGFIDCKPTQTSARFGQAAPGLVQYWPDLDRCSTQVHRYRPTLACCRPCWPQFPPIFDVGQLDTSWSVGGTPGDRPHSMANRRSSAIGSSPTPLCGTTQELAIPELTGVDARQCWYLLDGCTLKPSAAPTISGNSLTSRNGEELGASKYQPPAPRPAE